MGNIVNLEKGQSPFNPGQPVRPEMFVGRQEYINRVLRSVGQVVAGKQENLFVTGEYGIGKSSLVSFVRLLGEQKSNVAGFHVLLGGVTTLEGMVQHIVSRVIQQAHRSGALPKIRGLLGRYIENIELFGVKIDIGALKSDAPKIAQDFLPFLRRLWETLKADYSGFALYLDDLNGITRSPDFAALIKSLVDEIATSGQPFPLLLTLAGVPERRMEILANQPSVKRIFDVVELDPLGDDEVELFFKRAFESVNMSVSADVLWLLVRYSGGLPELMHELGHAVFWEDKDNIVDDRDAIAGLIEAANIVGRKYFQPISHALRSGDYHSILNKLGKLKADLTFRKIELAEGLNQTERRKLDNFLQRMKRLHALSPGTVRGEWAFPNRLLRVYLRMESQRTRKKRLSGS